MAAKNQTPAERAETLRKHIEEANYRYYVLDDPTLSDAEYDAQMNELRQVETEHPELVTPDSPTQRVSGQPADEFAMVGIVIGIILAAIVNTLYVVFNSATWTLAYLQFAGMTSVAPSAPPAPPAVPAA